MKKLQIDETQAKSLYSTAKEFKQILEDTFGKEYFQDKITDRIKTINDVYNYLNIKREDVIPFKELNLTKQQKSINALFDIQNISLVLNENVILDWNNNNQLKYYPYFEKKASGWVVDSCRSCYYYAVVGFGCYYKSSELALYAANTFKNIYIDYLPE